MKYYTGTVPEISVLELNYNNTVQQRKTFRVQRKLLLVKQKVIQKKR